MIIEINKDIDKYKESVVLGLTAKQLIYSILSVIVGGSVVFLLYPYVGLTVSAYIAIPVVAPIALTGFYSYHGMSFLQKMRLKLHFAFDEMNYMDDKSSTVTMQVGDSLGRVWATAYCPCAQCCGKYANGITASGKKAKPKHTIAVDARGPIVPMGTKVIIEGVEYTVEDTGDLNHYGNDFDIYYAKHEQTSEWGRRHVEAFLAEGNTNTVEVKTQGTMVHNLTYEDYISTGKFDGTQTALLKEMMKDENWEYVANGTGGRAVADLAVTKIGCRYDQGRRMQEGYYDCSSLVHRLYKEVGIVLPDTAAEQGNDHQQEGLKAGRPDLLFL